ncbi:DNA-processing protein DprA [Poseidonocella sedimentorum]|uniref:DNA protecting protein DprA n=1 Tax=Poseidonocella sedimentorum TaxID=871652 RepID=A0A1I6CPK3_9RHOB|nr:DNA-processing protein DprA [Poseidonocella sedimentorum]SFQ95084.1 DNA protecting protein DprA [Poseidonocella sedimentorum]
MTGDDFSSTHPPLPPTTEDDRLTWLRLLRSRRVGPTTFHKLLAEHGSIQDAFEALPKLARDSGVTAYSPCPLEEAEAEYDAALAAGARMLCIGDRNYPDTLADLSDAPPLLWCRGDIALLRRPNIALVGARNASSLGIRMARSLARDLGRVGFVVASGLARGIDTAAHEAALELGTVAVMAGGVDVIYPSENRLLAEEIVERGVMISEQPMGLRPTARMFPTRNRIVSGLSIATVVVEAAARSGSLITARNALDQGREVLAVPGHPLDARAGGCNLLIRDGARLVRDAEDVIEAVREFFMPPPEETETQEALDLAAAAEDPPQTGADTAPEADPDRPAPPAPTSALQDTAALHSRIMERLGPSPIAEDQLIRDLASAPEILAPALLDLELEGRVLRQPGGLLSRAC